MSFPLVNYVIIMMSNRVLSYWSPCPLRAYLYLCHCSCSMLLCTVDVPFVCYVLSSISLRVLYRLYDLYNVFMLSLMSVGPFFIIMSLSYVSMFAVLNTVYHRMLRYSFLLFAIRYSCYICVFYFFYMLYITYICCWFCPFDPPPCSHCLRMSHDFVIL
jgi:hypothetical protein